MVGPHRHRPDLLGAGLIYGIVNYRGRSRAAKQETERATERLYRNGDRQERQ